MPSDASGAPAQKEPSGAARMLGDFAPGLVSFTDDVLFGEVWQRPGLSRRDRSLVTVACLTTSGNTDQLVFHLGEAKRNGVGEDELIEAITHLAFYADRSSMLPAGPGRPVIASPGDYGSSRTRRSSSA